VPLGRIVAENLHALRLRHKLSQRALAKKCGISVSYVSMLERGERTPPLETLGVLAKALAVSPWSLFREPATERRQARRRLH
jgi:transcriptional regulator with XRE-family HTH domain